MLTPDEESRRVHSAVVDLEREFPDVPAEQIESLVTRIWSEFRAARVRDFVPVLVGAAARDTLRTRHVRSA